MDSKREQVRQFLQREVANALSMHIAKRENRQNSETIRSERTNLSTQIAWHISEQYRFLELADIMEWKRTRVRR